MLITCSVCHLARLMEPTHVNELSKPSVCDRCSWSQQEREVKDYFVANAPTEQFFVPRPPPLFEELGSSCGWDP